MSKERGPAREGTSLKMNWSSVSWLPDTGATERKRGSPTLAAVPWPRHSCDNPNTAWVEAPHLPPPNDTGQLFNLFDQHCCHQQQLLWKLNEMGFLLTVKHHESGIYYLVSSFSGSRSCWDTEKEKAILRSASPQFFLRSLAMWVALQSQLQGSEIKEDSFILLPKAIAPLEWGSVCLSSGSTQHSAMRWILTWGSAKCHTHAWH